MSDEATKACPFCAETIKAAAVVCRFCGKDLAAPVVSSGPTDRQLLDTEIAEYTKAGWRVVSQSESGAQFVKPKQWSTLGLTLLVALPAIGGCLWWPLFGVALIGLLIVFADYAGKKEETRYITASTIRDALAATKSAIARITPDGKGGYTCSACNGFVRLDANECKHCKKPLAATAAAYLSS